MFVIMGFWLTILATIILVVAFLRKGKTVPHKASDFRDNEFDDEIEDYDRMLGDDL